MSLIIKLGILFVVVGNLNSSLIPEVSKNSSALDSNKAVVFALQYIGLCSGRAYHKDILTAVDRSAADKICKDAKMTLATFRTLEEYTCVRGLLTAADNHLWTGWRNSWARDCIIDDSLATLPTGVFANNVTVLGFTMSADVYMNSRHGGEPFGTLCMQQ